MEGVWLLRPSLDLVTVIDTTRLALAADTPEFPLRHWHLRGAGGAGMVLVERLSSGGNGRLACQQWDLQVVIHTVETATLER